MCEEIARFALNDTGLMRRFKAFRHLLDELTRRLCAQRERLLQRNSVDDAGFKVYGNELKRKGLGDIFFANIQRVKESIRVLEEFGKLKDRNAALSFKKIRYDLYAIEKKAYRKIESSFRTQ